MYNEKVMDHFKNPRNLKKLKNPDAVGKIGNPNCGDIMECAIKVGKNKDGEEIITDIGVQTFGCVAAIATSSMTTDLAKGKTLAEAKKITRDSISKALGSLPKLKEHCSNLAAEALHKAIENYEKKKSS